MAWETGFNPRSSHTRLKKWYLIPPCLTLGIIRYVLRVKRSNPRKGVVLSSHLGVVAIEKEAFKAPSTKGRQLYFIYIQLLTIQSGRLGSQVLEETPVLEKKNI